MRKSFVINTLVALIFFNATFSFAQNTIQVDSILREVESDIKLEKYSVAHSILDSIESLPIYKIQNEKLKIDLVRAKLYNITSNEEIAIQILMEGLTIAKTNKSSKYTALYAYEIGCGFSDIKDYLKASQYFRLVLRSSIYSVDSIGISKGYLALGAMHFKMYKKMAFSILDKADSISHQIRGDSIKYYYDKSIIMFPKLEKNKEVLANVYTNKAAFCYYNGTYDSIEYFGNKSLNILTKMGDSIEMARVINIMAVLNYHLKNYNVTEKLYLQGFDLVQNRSDIESANLSENFIMNLGNLYYTTKDFKLAYEYRTWYDVFKDSIRDASSNEKYAEYVAKYNFSEKEKLAEIEKNRRQNAEIWLYIVGISTVLLLLFLWLFFRTQKVRKEKEVLQLQKENLTSERELERVQNESRIKILNATLDGKESERRQIAEILHNSVSALLSSAGLHLQAAKNVLKGKAPEEVEKSQEIVKEAGEKIRNLSHALISSVLLKFGLKYALDELCEKYSNSKLKFNCNAREIHRYDSSFEIKMHSIIEELMNNIIKHSNATIADIILKEENGVLRVRIFDNGDGFDVDKLYLSNESGLGLPQIDARIKMMIGEFNIQSSEKAGTRIYMNVPVPIDD